MIKHLTVLRVNGQVYEVSVEPRQTLLEVLRNDLGLTGAKNACDLGECGSCTVLMDGDPVLSCLILAIDAQNKDIVTIEGIAGRENLHPIQQAFVDHGAIQCGYCTPGMILTAKALLDRVPNPREDEVREAISGNLCRCTGYDQIVKAILSAAKG